MIACTELAIDPAHLTYELMQAFWVEDQDITNLDTLKRIITNHSLDPNQLMNFAKNTRVSHLLDSYTDEAILKGVFGVPSYVIEDEIFWGQDRLDLLDQKLTQKDSRTPNDQE